MYYFKGKKKLFGKATLVKNLTSVATKPDVSNNFLRQLEKNVEKKRKKKGLTLELSSKKNFGKRKVLIPNKYIF